MRGVTASFSRLCLLPVLMLGGIGSAAAAQGADGGALGLGAGYTAQDAPLGQPTDLRIDLRGEVSARCRMAAPPVISQQIDLTRPGDAEAKFGLDCNTPFSLRVRSGQGGFAAEEAINGVARQVPYEISVNVDTDSGANALGWCRAEDLLDQAAGACAYGTGTGWSSGEATAINRNGTMRMRWSAPGEGDSPVLGRYRDTIVVELTVRS